MSKYRFKTKEEFIRDELWREDVPYLWNSEGKMNKYLGQDIPEEFNDKCDKGVVFKYENWGFSSNDYVLKEPPVDMKAIQEEAKKRFPIGCSFKNTNGNIYTLIKDDDVYEIYGKSIWAHIGSGCLYQDGKWAELISLPEPVSLNEFKKGNYIVLIGKGQSISDSELIQSNLYIQNHCYKVKENGTYLRTELDSGGNITNGWKCIPYNPNKFHKTRNWRYATPEEIAEYDRIGKPYDVTTLQNKKEESIPEYVECVSPLLNTTVGKIYKVINHQVCESDSKGNYYNWKSSEFKPSTKEAYEAQLLPKKLTKKDLIEGEIYFYDNSHISVYPEGPSFSISDKIYLPNPKWEWTLHIEPATEEQKSLLKSEIEKYSCRTTILEEYTPQIGDYVVMKKSECPLEICRQKYKKGMVVKSAQERGMYSGTFTINANPEEFTITGEGIDYFGSAGFLYYEGKYAEILSYPDEQSKLEYSNSKDSVLNEITIQKETFIEDVQSVDVMLRTKKKSIKF